MGSYQKKFEWLSAFKYDFARTIRLIPLIWLKTSRRDIRADLIQYWQKKP